MICRGDKPLHFGPVTTVPDWSIYPCFAVYPNKMTSYKKLTTSYRFHPLLTTLESQIFHFLLIHFIDKFIGPLSAFCKTCKENKRLVKFKILFDITSLHFAAPLTEEDARAVEFSDECLTL